MGKLTLKVLFSHDDIMELCRRAAESYTPVVHQLGSGGTLTPQPMRGKWKLDWIYGLQVEAQFVPGGEASEECGREENV